MDVFGTVSSAVDLAKSIKASINKVKDNDKQLADTASKATEDLLRLQGILADNGRTTNDPQLAEDLTALESQLTSTVEKLNKRIEQQAQNGFALLKYAKQWKDRDEIASTLQRVDALVNRHIQSFQTVGIARLQMHAAEASARDAALEELGARILSELTARLSLAQADPSMAMTMVSSSVRSLEAQDVARAIEADNKVISTLDAASAPLERTWLQLRIDSLTKALASNSAFFLPAESPNVTPLPDLSTTVMHLSSIHEPSEDEENAFMAAVSITRTLQNSEASVSRQDVADSLVRLSIVLRDLGLAEEALETMERACDLWRSLRTLPPSPESESNYAVCLHNLSNRLSYLGRYEDALTTIEQAVGIYRTLVGAYPASFDTQLAQALSTRAHRLARLRKWDEACAAQEASVSIYRTLSEANSLSFRAGLAGALSNFSGYQSECGDRYEARRSVDEAISIYRELIGGGSTSHRPQLASALLNLSMILSDQGRRNNVPLAEEAVGIFEELAKSRPAFYMPDLANALNVLSDILSDNLDNEGAFQASGRAVEVYRNLSGLRPAVFTPDLGLSLVTLALRLGDKGRGEDGLVTLNEAIPLLKTAAETRPAIWQSSVTAALSSRRRLLCLAGRTDETAASEVGQGALPDLVGGRARQNWTPRRWAVAMSNIRPSRSATRRAENSMFPQGL